MLQNQNWKPECIQDWVAYLYLKCRFFWKITLLKTFIVHGWTYTVQQSAQLAHIKLVGMSAFAQLCVSFKTDVCVCVCLQMWGNSGGKRNEVSYPVPDSNDVAGICSDRRPVRAVVPEPKAAPRLWAQHRVKSAGGAGNEANLPLPDLLHLHTQSWHAHWCMCDLTEAQTCVCTHTWAHQRPVE